MKYRITIPFPFKGRALLKKYFVDNDFKIINEGFTRPARWVCEIDIAPEDATFIALTLGFKVREFQDDDKLILFAIWNPLIDYIHTKNNTYPETIKILKPRVSGENQIHWDPNFKILDFKD